MELNYNANYNYKALHSNLALTSSESLKLHLRTKDHNDKKVPLLSGFQIAG